MKLLRILIIGTILGLIAYGTYTFFSTDADIASPVPDDMLQIIRLTPKK